MIGDVAETFPFVFKHSSMQDIVTVRIMIPMECSDFKSAKDISLVTFAVVLLAVFYFCNIISCVQTT